MGYKYCLIGLVFTLSLLACSEQKRAPAVLKTPAVSTADGVSQSVEVRQAQAQPRSVIAMDVYKSPSCGCCGKSEWGIAPQYQSCHTVVSDDGYVFEGHIPARFLQQFLAAPPADALGLSVPAMPMGSPGMEMGDRFTPYQVLLLKRDGSAEIYGQVSSPLEQY